MDRVKAAEQTSGLPENPDLDWIDAFVAEAHGWEVTCAL